MIGDYDPEDAWDDSDSTDDKLLVLERLIADLRRRNDDRHDLRVANGLRLLSKIIIVNRRQERRLNKVRRTLERLG